LSNTDKKKVIVVRHDEVERLYDIYLRVQSGDKSALDELFVKRENKEISKVDEMNREYRLSHMDNILDSEIILETEKNRQEEEWIGSASSSVIFNFDCLNKIVSKNKRDFLSNAKYTGYENGERRADSRSKKFYEGEYDVSDLNEFIYEIVIEIFNAKTDENNCLTLYGRKNTKYPICDGVSLLKNISFYTIIAVNKRAKKTYLDVSDIGHYCEGCDDVELFYSLFDKVAEKEFLEKDGGSSRLLLYAECLEWIKKNDIHNLFNTNSYDIKAIIRLIMDYEDAFRKEWAGNRECMRLITQEELQEKIKFRYGIKIEQGNISKDMKLIEQRLLDHLLYSFNYKIDEAPEIPKNESVYTRESGRFLYERLGKAYVQIFSRATYQIYERSVLFTDDKENLNDYLNILQKEEDIIIPILSSEKGKKKYDMVNVILENTDLVKDEWGALINVADTLIGYFQQAERDYIKNALVGYEIKGLADWENGYWEADLNNEVLKIKLFSSKNVKNPIRVNWSRENVMVYRGCVNYYFCDTKMKLCYKVPKNRRIISKMDKYHKNFIYNIK